MAIGGILKNIQDAGGMTPKEHAAAQEQYMRDRKTVTAPAEQAIQAGIDQRNQLLSQPQPRPAMPNLQSVPQAPVQELRNPVQAFGNGAIVLATLGSLFTRRPATTALNAASAAMKAFNSGDKDRLEIEHKNWKNALDATIAQNQVELQGYTAAFQDAQLSRADMMAQIQGIAASNQDQQMLAAIATGNLDAAYKIIEARQASATQLAQIQAEADYRSATLAETIRSNKAAESASGGLDINNDWDAGQALVSMAQAGMAGTPEYKAIYNRLAQPKESFNPSTNRIEKVYPDMSAFQAPGTSGPAQPTPAPSAPFSDAANEAQRQSAAAPAAPAPRPIEGGIVFEDIPGMPKLTEGQSNALLFAARLAGSSPIITQFEDEGLDLYQKGLTKVPFELGRYGMTPEFKQYQQAKEDFLRATLRKESGAVISAEEMAGGDLQYFPVPGDDAATIAQKRKNRQVVEETMKLVAGPGAPFVQQIVQQVYGTPSASAPAGPAAQPRLVPESQLNGAGWN